MTAAPRPMGAVDGRASERPVAAVTGGTGFLGRHVVRALDEAGWQVRLLARRDVAHPLFDGLALEVVPGSLEDGEALGRLCRGASLLVHGAALIKARNAAEFMAVNGEGSRRAARALASAGAPDSRLLAISSFAAREPHLSAYAASKRAGEEAVREVLPDRSLIVRPPAIYGPWDRETLAIFQAARRPVVPVPGGPDARLALIQVEDCAAAIAALARGGQAGRTYELADGVPGGYGWAELLDAATEAVGRHPLRLRVPPAALRLAGAMGDLQARLTGRAVMLTSGKVREMLHCDWSAQPDLLPPAGLWRPQVGLRPGFQAAVRWYRAQGWLG